MSAGKPHINTEEAKKGSKDPDIMPEFLPGRISILPDGR